MKRIMTLGIFAVALGGATATLADDDDCRSPMSQWQSQDTAIQHAGALGIEVRRLKIDDGCYEIKGRDSDGNKVELKLEPATLALRELEVEFRAGSDPSRYLAGAKGPAPMQRKVPAHNPLFEKGSKPKVEAN